MKRAARVTMILAGASLAVAPIAVQAESGRSAAQIDALAGMFASSAVANVDMGSASAYDSLLNSIESDVLSVVALPCASQQAGCILPLRATDQPVAAVPPATPAPPPTSPAPVAATGGGGGIGALPILLGLAAVGGLAFLVLDDDDNDEVRSPGG